MFGDPIPKTSIHITFCTLNKLSQIKIGNEEEPIFVDFYRREPSKLNGDLLWGLTLELESIDLKRHNLLN